MGCTAKEGGGWDVHTGVTGKRSIFLNGLWELVNSKSWKGIRWSKDGQAVNIPDRAHFSDTHMEQITRLCAPEKRWKNFRQSLRNFNFYYDESFGKNSKGIQIVHREGLFIRGQPQLVETIRDLRSIKRELEKSGSSIKLPSQWGKVLGLTMFYHYYLSPIRSRFFS